MSVFYFQKGEVQNYLLMGLCSEISLIQVDDYKREMLNLQSYAKLAWLQCVEICAHADISLYMKV